MNTSDTEAPAPLWVVEKWLAERHIAELLPALGVDCVVDVGAHEGTFSAMVRRTGFTGPILSFEPQQAPRAVLESRAKGDAKWHVYPFALSDTRESASMVLRSISQFTSLEEPDLDSGIAKADGVREMLAETGIQCVELRRLDSFTVPGKRIFLKVDTQGHDAKVLSGASGIFARVAALQIEMTQDALYRGARTADVEMRALRLKGFGLNAAFPVWRDETTGVMLEFDGVFTRMG